VHKLDHGGEQPRGKGTWASTASERASSWPRRLEREGSLIRVSTKLEAAYLEDILNVKDQLGEETRGREC
jgi:hypothetical protein